MSTNFEIDEEGTAPMPDFDLIMPERLTPAQRIRRALMAREHLRRRRNRHAAEHTPAEHRRWCKEFYTPRTDAVSHAKDDAMARMRVSFHPLADENAELAAVDPDTAFRERAGT